jgi:hypothetical protein
MDDVQASVLVFVYPGSASQVRAGFLITFAAIIVSLSLSPFADRTLGAMYSFSLIVEALTLFSGIMIITKRLVSALDHHFGVHSQTLYPS